MAWEGGVDMTANYQMLLREIRGEFRCSKCGRQITISSKSGLCKSCVRKFANLKRMTRNCRCGKKISSWNSSGLCTDCLRKRQRRYYILSYSNTKRNQNKKQDKGVNVGFVKRNLTLNLGNIVLCIGVLSAEN